MTATSKQPLELKPFSILCRGCLAESGEMKNMYEWGLSEDFYVFTNIPVIRSEGTSELLCSTCEEALISCKRFRMQCQRSDMLLKDTVKIKQEDPTGSDEEGKKISISRAFQDNLLLISISTMDMESKIYLPCPYQCSNKYQKQKDLLTHLIKSHNVDKNFVIELRYHCPYKNCTYNETDGMQKHFSGRKFLNQHINKVHRSKNIVCDTCSLNFHSESEFNRHRPTCSYTFICAECNAEYKTNERLLVHLKRKHPESHKAYKEGRRPVDNLKRTADTFADVVKKQKQDLKTDSVAEYMCDSPKRSFATQTFIPENSIKNDVTLPSWNTKNQDDIDRNFSTIETQTVFEDLLSLKSQNSEEDSIFFSETVSLSDIQTQTFPVEFGLSRKETITSETQTRESPDLSIKETQTCFCLFESPKINFRLFDSVNSSPSSISLASTETQTAEVRSNVKSDVLLGFNSTETQTCFEEGLGKKGM